LPAEPAPLPGVPRPPTGRAEVVGGRIPPILIVGAERTADRVEEHRDADRGRGYLRFLVEQLKPLVAARPWNSTC